MPSWWTNPQFLNGLLATCGLITPLLIAALAWIASMGGLKSLSRWLSSHEEKTKDEAINRITKGLTAAQPNVNASECVNELVAGLDQWQLARQRTRGRTAGLRRCVGACWVFLFSVAGGWVSEKIGDPARGIEQTFLVMCMLAVLIIVFYGYPLVGLVMENGLPHQGDPLREGSSSSPFEHRISDRSSNHTKPDSRLAQPN
jgi:hypothetical protein